MLFILLLLISYLCIYEINGFTRKNSNVILQKPILGERIASLYAKVSLTTDDGIKKEQINSGKGKAMEAGDIIAIEYTAKVKGQNKPFAKADQEQLVYQDGTMIKGWDIAMSSMTIGEKAFFEISSKYAYGEKGVGSIIPSGADIELDVKVLAWLGNQLRPESLFSKDLDVDPFIASTPESIRAEYEEMQVQKNDKYEGSVFDIYLRRLKNISFGFGGSGFFQSQSGEKAPWYLNPNLTFPAMFIIVLAAFFTVVTTGSVREKGIQEMDLEVATLYIRSMLS